MVGGVVSNHCGVSAENGAGRASSASAGLYLAVVVGGEFAVDQITFEVAWLSEC